VDQPPAQTGAATNTKPARGPRLQPRGRSCPTATLLMYSMTSICRPRIWRMSARRPKRI
jgi:hypothetical protein